MPPLFYLPYATNVGDTATVAVDTATNGPADADSAALWYATKAAVDPSAEGVTSYVYPNEFVAQMSSIMVNPSDAAVIVSVPVVIAAVKLIFIWSPEECLTMLELEMVIAMLPPFRFICLPYTYGRTFYSMHRKVQDLFSINCIIL